MKKAFLILGTLLFMIGIMIGCKKQSNEPTGSGGSGSDDARYYIRYEVSTQTIYTGYNTIVDINTEYGIQHFTSGSSFNETFGPVQYGFEASIETYTTLSFSGTTNAMIYVCREGEPFVLKATKTASLPSDSNPLKATYKIDF